MSLLGRAGELEKKLSKLIRGLISGEAGPHQLEIRQWILDEVEGKIQPVGDGATVFPYNHLTVTLHAPDEDRRYFFESAFLEGGRLKSDIRDRLIRSGSRLPRHLAIEIKFTDRADPGWEDKGFQIEYRKHSASGGRPAARLVVLRGESPQESYPLGESNFNIGRLREVRDKQDRIARRNDLAFAEGADEVGQSVSRVHAHIFFDEQEGSFRLCDDNSAQGTHVFREGRLIEVPANSPRGVKLHAGDEIYFGKAHLRFEVGPPEQVGAPEPEPPPAAAAPTPEPDAPAAGEPDDPGGSTHEEVAAEADGSGAESRQEAQTVTERPAAPAESPGGRGPAEADLTNPAEDGAG